MFHLAPLHPRVVEGPDGDAFFSRAEKEAQILDFYHEQQFIPVNIDHRGADQRTGVLVDPRECVGRVVDLFNGRDGFMVVKLQLDNTHPQYGVVRRSILQRGEKWGVSVGISLNYETGRKRLVHVAITRDPLFARYGTMVHYDGLVEWLVDREIARRYYAPGQGQSFAAAPLKAKLRGM
jgi:hypothetical protein